jgi:hypothetical protein
MHPREFALAARVYPLPEVIFIAIRKSRSLVSLRSWPRPRHEKDHLDLLVSGTRSRAAFSKEVLEELGAE